jgi:putative restriction endonuclease
MSGDFLITWKPEGWPYSRLKKLIGDFEQGREAREDWRFAAHRKVRPGDRVYLYKQGASPRGVFGVGRAGGVPKRNPSAGPNQREWQVPIVFDLIVDPYKSILVGDEELAKLPAPKHRWSNQSSGISLEAAVARGIDVRIASTVLLHDDEGDDQPFDPDNIQDARERIRRAIIWRRGQHDFRHALLDAYEGKCAITGCDLPDILEAAHIVPYRGLETNNIRNGLLLRSDIHTLFDCGLLSIDSKSMSVVLAERVSKTSYRALAGKKVRKPKRVDQSPSVPALDAHRRNLRRS